MGLQLGAVAVELVFGYGLVRYLRTLCIPTWRVKPRVPNVAPGSVTLPSDTVGLT